MSILGKIKQKRALDAGLKQFLQSGVTPEAAYLAMRWCHCDSLGASTDALAQKLAPLRPIVRENSPSGLLDAERSQALAALQKDGFYVFSQRLDAESCTGLQRFALTHSAQLFPPPQDGDATGVYDAQDPQSETYRFQESDILAQPEVQNLVADASLRQLARDYLNCEPIFDLTAMWWSTPSRKASSAAAQLYHFDLDRVKWLKFFVYLSDVTPTRGPHCYLRGTHIPSASSRALLGLGDRRIEDEEIESLGLKGAESEICGPVGTILVADTRGHHKGKPPLEGDRLLLQLEFADSLFGADYQKIGVANPSPLLQSAAQSAPQVYERLKLGS